MYLTEHPLVEVIEPHVIIQSSITYQYIANNKHRQELWKQLSQDMARFLDRQRSSRSVDHNRERKKLAGIYKQGETRQDKTGSFEQAFDWWEQCQSLVPVFLSFLLLRPSFFLLFLPFLTPPSLLALGSWEGKKKTVGARLQEDGRDSGLRGTSGLWLALCLGW